jgi:hypothetical protein
MRPSNAAPAQTCFGIGTALPFAFRVVVRFGVPFHDDSKLDVDVWIFATAKTPDGSTASNFDGISADGLEPVR